MNERIRELAEQAGGNPNYKAFRGHFLPPPPDYIDPATVDLEKFAELIVRECSGLIHLECEDFANGNCFHDDTLWKSVTTEYGKNKERGFDPIGMSIHFDKLLKKHFGVEE